MTSGQGHINDRTNDQRVSRHSLPTLLYFLFSPPHIFFNSNKRSDSRAPLKEKSNKRVILELPANGTLAFAPTAQDNPSGKIQRAFFCQRYDSNNLYIQ